jgi:dTDP-4-amino-4,6-dideoxygalactose transaminase
MKILCSNPLEQFKSKQKIIKSSINKVLNSSNYILGQYVQKFEKNFCNFIGTRYGVGVANGTDAVEIALKALNIGTGHEVITVSHTALATVAAIISTGAKPVLVDIEESRFTIDIGMIEKNITKRTKALVLVHIYGQSTDIDKIIKICKKNKIKLIEDTSQAHCGKWKNNYLGTYGDLSTFSFYPTKNLGAIGDGGFICTNNKKLYEKARQIREYGWNKNRIANVVGRNSRLDEIQASILDAKLKFLKKDTIKRQLIAKLYKKEIKCKDVKHPLVNTHQNHAFHLYVVKVKKRNDLIKYLKKKNIFCGIHYPYPIHLQPGYKNKIIIKQKLKITERVSKEILSLPIYPELSLNKVKQISRLINNFYN